MPLSGTQWVGQFPTSTSTADLTPTFRAAVDAFLAALDQAGAKHKIAATFRPVERAFLMHWCYRIGYGNFDSRQVPIMNGVDINWVHLNQQGRYDETASRRAARAMAGAYGIDYAPALASRHTQGRAIDMRISWSGTLSIIDQSNVTVNITTAPKDGLNTDLHLVGSTFGVHKLAVDPPHWSDDGH